MNATLEVLSALIMETRTKADTAETYQEHEKHMREYKFLRKRWAFVAGKAVIGIEIKKYMRESHE